MGANGQGRGQAAVQSVDRAVTILEILARRREAGVTEIAAELGVHKSTAFRLVVVLEDHGLVEQATERGKYRLGFGVVRLAGSAAAQLDLAQESQAACEDLVEAVGETANVAILDEGWATNISEVRGEAAVVSQSWVGRRTPLHATSSGKVLLAFQPKGEREQILARPLEAFTTQTVIEADLLRVELAQIRERGWSSTCEELEVGLNAVAAPIRGPGGSVVAAVSVSGPSYRLGPPSFAEVAELVQAAAAQISARLGHVAA
jgi:IclR family transcriptional regulator, acetate operon repressor